MLSTVHHPFGVCDSNRSKFQDVTPHLLFQLTSFLNLQYFVLTFSVQRKLFNRNASVIIVVQLLNFRNICQLLSSI